jgi:hypothetical protein
MSERARRKHDWGMETKDRLDTRASQLLQEARRFQSAAAQPGSHLKAPEALASLEEALQALSAAWYQLAADGSPGIVGRHERRGSDTRSSPTSNGLPHEQEAHLTGTLHDVAAAFARCARVCRDGRTEVTRLMSRRRAAVARAVRLSERVAWGNTRTRV